MRSSEKLKVIQTLQLKYRLISITSENININSAVKISLLSIFDIH